MTSFIMVHFSQQVLRATFKTYHNRKKIRLQDFPGGTVVKNLPANAGDTGSSPGLGRSHMPPSNQARVPQLLSLCSRAHEPQLLAHVPQLLKPVHLEPLLCEKRSHRNEKPTHHKEE